MLSEKRVCLKNSDARSCSGVFSGKVESGFPSGNTTKIFVTVYCSKADGAVQAVTRGPPPSALEQQRPRESQDLA